MHGTFTKNKTMKFPSAVSQNWIATLIDASIKSRTDKAVTGINELHRVEEGDLVFVDHPKYYDKCLASAANFIIANIALEVPEGKAVFVTEKPFEAYRKIVQHFRPTLFSSERISSSATIAEDTHIFPTAYIGNFVRIGKRCTIHPNVSILDYCEIGDDVIIQAGTVIGSDAFYYNSNKKNENWYTKMPSCGNVIIEDGVEIGANCTIDRGVSSDTIIGAGTKMDNQIHIGHDTVIGKNCLFAAGTTVAGIVDFGDGVTVWGRCAISKTLSIGNNAVLLAMSGVGGNLEANKTYWGAPAEEASAKKRELVWIKRIPQLWDKIMSEKK